MRLLPLVAVSGLLLSTGCAQSSLYGSKFMPLGQVKTVLASEKSTEPLLGRVDQNGSSLAGFSTAVAANGGYKLDWDDIEDGHLCVSTETKSWFPAEEDRGEERDLAFIRGLYSADTIVFESKKTLDDITEATQWDKTPPKTSIDKLRVKVLSKEYSQHADGTTGVKEGYKVRYKVFLCGPAPVIAADTRYVLVTRYLARSNFGVAPSYFIWSVGHDGSAASAKPAVSAADNAAPADAPARTPPSPSPTAAPVTAVAAASSDVASAVAAAGCSVFAKALVDTGVAETLKTGGPYTVLAPTDAAIHRSGAWEDAKKDPEKLKQLVSNHVLTTQSSLADFRTQTAGKKKRDVVLVPTLAGDSLRLERSTSGMKVGRGTIRKPDIATTNAVVQVVDEVTAPK